MKYIILFIILLMLSSLSYGQANLGVFIGFNNSKLKGDAPENSSYKSLIGLNAGANIDLKIAPSLWLSLQPSYVQEGTNISYTVSGMDEPVDSIKIRLNYFSIPLLLKVATANNRFYAIGGIETSFLLNSTLTSNDVTEDIKLNLESLNIAMHFGAGLWIPIGFPRLFVELRYAQGLLNLTKEPLDNDIIPRIKTGGFKVLAGIEIPLQKSDK